jgi:geranylgeranyl diphosphate synthase type II
MDRLLAPSLELITDRLRPHIDAALQAYCKLPAGCPPRLREAMHYSLLAPGKRLRPSLVLLAAQACASAESGDTELVPISEILPRAMPAACAVEMIHAYSLVHDDLPAMDDDDLRRGRPTCHKVYGDALAILTGDALLTLAFEVLAHGVKPPSVAAACCAALAEAAGPCQLVGGQADDVQAEGKPMDRELLESIHRRKTGAMIRVSLRLGAMVAGAPANEVEALNEYGTHLGLAFQVTDDLLDVQSNEKTVGKRVGKDVERGKLTFPSLLGVDQSIVLTGQLVDKACSALEPLGFRGSELLALARYVGERNH